MPDEAQTGTFNLNANPAENIANNEVANPLNTGNGVNPATPVAPMPTPAPIQAAPTPIQATPIPVAPTPTVAPPQVAAIQQIPEAATNIDLDKQLESQLANIEEPAPKEKKVLNYKNLALLGISIIAIGISVFIIFKILGASKAEQADMNNKSATSETAQETTPPPGVDNPFPAETTTDVPTDAPSDAMLELQDTAKTLEETINQDTTTIETPPGLIISPEETTTQDNSVKRAR